MCGKRSGRRCEKTTTWGFACMAYCRTDDDCPDGSECRLFGSSWYSCNPKKKDGGK